VAERAPLRTRSAAIPDVALIAGSAFAPRLSAAGVLAAIARGLQAGGMPAPDACELTSAEGSLGELKALLSDLDFDARMRRARAVIVAAPRLDERTLEGSPAFEIATRARQAGVPCYAVPAESELDAFDARMLDLQAIQIARSTRALAAAGKRLAQLI
jgi:glycerate kinase